MVRGAVGVYQPEGARTLRRGCAGVGGAFEISGGVELVPAVRARQLRLSGPALRAVEDPKDHDLVVIDPADHDVGRSGNHQLTCAFLVPRTVSMRELLQGECRSAQAAHHSGRPGWVSCAM